MSSPSYSTNTRRTAWMAARARNAAKRGGLIANVGMLAVATTLVLLVLIPREVNRTVRARLDALPPIVDTLPLQANLTGAMDRVRNAEASLQYLRQADADRVASATSNPGSAINTEIAPSGAVVETDARRELGMRISRARTAPLVENFRALGETELLRNETRARVVLDSLNDLSRDREAYAALGGPDARYAAMTAKLTSFGQRLLVIADQVFAASGTPATVAPVPAPASVASPATAPPATSSTPSAAGVPTTGVAAAPTDTTVLAPVLHFGADSGIEHAARLALDTAKSLLQVAEKALADVRASNTRVQEERVRAEADSPARVPPVAMLIAALVTGLAVGFGVAFFIEVKRPRVADAAEVERVIDARVILHATDARSARSLLGRRDAGDALPPVIDAASEAYQLLHVTLTGYGDTSREVEVIASDALLGATIGINLAAAAVRDSRATLLVDASTPPRIVNRLLRNAGDLSKKKSKVVTPVPVDASITSQLIPTRVGRDQTIDTLAMTGAITDRAQEELREIAHDHDFTVVVRSDGALSTQAPPLPVTDVILCARVGVTRLDWLIARAAELRAQNHRVRAVLLWATRAPTFR